MSLLVQGQLLQQGCLSLFLINDRGRLPQKASAMNRIGQISFKLFNSSAGLHTCWEREDEEEWWWGWKIEKKTCWNKHSEPRNQALIFLIHKCHSLTYSLNRQETWTEQKRKWTPQFNWVVTQKSCVNERMQRKWVTFVEWLTEILIVFIDN